MASIVFHARKFVKFLFEQKLRNAIDGSVVYIAVSTEEAMEVLRPLSKDRSIGSEEVPFIRTAYLEYGPMSAFIHCY